MQYVSIKYTERLADAGIEPSVGSVGDSYDNALAETINGLYKAELIHRRGPWRSFEAVERGGRVCLNTVSLSVSGISAGLDVRSGGLFGGADWASAVWPKATINRDDKRIERIII